MAARRRFIAILTFLAGLYFLLEFVLPPTVPGRTSRGIYLSHDPTVVRLRTGAGDFVDVAVRPGVELSMMVRDPTGKLQAKVQRTREVSVGETLTARTRTFVFGGLRNGLVVDAEGAVAALRPGEQLYLDGSEETPADLAALPIGSKVRVEVRSARVAEVQWGSVTLLQNRERATIQLGPHVAVLREKRKGTPDEIEPYEARVGDTLAIGHTTFLRDQRDTAAQFNTVLGTLALGMGLLSLAMVNGRKLKRSGEDRWVALAFFAAVAVGVCAGVYKYYDPNTTERAFSDTIVFRLLGPVGSTIFSLLAFYLASAAYRAFRIRSAEAALMMATALIVMLGQTPFGMYLTGWLGEQLKALWLPNVAGWILRVPNSAVVRGLIFGTMLGGIGTALRYWLNLEKGSAMGGGD
ncbi:MAG: hypothetical protein N2109_05965 [Fimbriimonadales bacterium]|nr:hypothetical protein [Fimbriimonadales bacterium]